MDRWERYEAEATRAAATCLMLASCVQASPTMHEEEPEASIKVGKLMLETWRRTGAPYDYGKQRVTLTIAAQPGLMPEPARTLEMTREEATRFIQTAATMLGVGLAYSSRMTPPADFGAIR